MGTEDTSENINDKLKRIQAQSRDLAEQKRRAQIREDLNRRGLTDLGLALEVLPPRSLENLDKFITEDPGMIELKEVVRHLCEIDDPVLIYGETGVGKEIIASALHGRRLGPFLAINTTSLPDNLLESELFGHVTGAFTGATKDRIGKLEAAQDGTVFLDEIGDMKPNMQEKLLRALQEREVTPVGSNAGRPINCRVIAATHKIIRQEYTPNTKITCDPKIHTMIPSTSGGVLWLKGFREDLYWRLASHELTITPLRERPDDIREILDKVLDPEHVLSDEFCDSLVTLPLSGNVRELQARVKRELLRIRIAKARELNK